MQEARPTRAGLSTTAHPAIQVGPVKPSELVSPESLHSEFSHFVPLPPYYSFAQFRCSSGALMESFLRFTLPTFLMSTSPVCGKGYQREEPAPCSADLRKAWLSFIASRA
jgi:hypothetical protein